MSAGITDDLLHKALTLVTGEDEMGAAHALVDAGWRPAHQVLEMVAEARREQEYEYSDAWQPIDRALTAMGYDVER